MAAVVQKTRRPPRAPSRSPPVSMSLIGPEAHLGPTTQPLRSHGGRCEGAGARGAKRAARASCGGRAGAHTPPRNPSPRIRAREPPPGEPGTSNTPNGRRQRREHAGSGHTTAEGKSEAGGPSKFGAPVRRPVTSSAVVSAGTIWCTLHTAYYLLPVPVPTYYLEPTRLLLPCRLVPTLSSHCQWQIPTTGRR